MTFTRISFAALAVAAVLSAGCYDDPLADGRGEATIIDTNRIETSLTVNRQFTVTARLLDAQFTPIPTALSATAGSNLRLDSTVYVTELRETRFFVTPTAMLASTPTTLTITGGGLSRTVEILAFPRSIESDVPAELQSGEVFSPTVLGFDELDGSLGSVPYTVESDDETIVEIGEGGTLIAKGVGLVELTFYGPGGSISEVVLVTVVPGTFGGTISQAPAGPGQTITITAGTVPFDADTKVTFDDPDGDAAFVTSRSASSLTVVVAANISSNQFLLSNTGPDQLALRGTFNLSGDGSDPHGEFPPDEPKITPGTTLYGYLPDGGFEFASIDVAASGTFDVVADWTDGSDIDFYVTDATFTLQFCSDDFVGCGMATGDHPETATTRTMAPGTYYVWIIMYSSDGAGAQYSISFTPN